MREVRGGRKEVAALGLGIWSCASIRREECECKCGECETFGAARGKEVSTIPLCTEGRFHMTQPHNLDGCAASQPLFATGTLRQRAWLVLHITQLGGHVRHASRAWLMQAIHKP